MFVKALILSISLLLLITVNAQVHPQQKIKDFYLSNFKEDGSRDWEVKGDEAVIHDRYVDIDTMKANYYLEEDTIAIQSDEARLDKTNMDVDLKGNVHIENKEGATVDSDSLRWKRDQNKIETKDYVEAERNDMKIKAQGLSADTQLKEADFNKDVEVTLPDEEGEGVTTITCSGLLEIEYEKGVAVFNDNVVAINPKGKMYSDKATLLFNAKQKEISKIISEGNVKIERDKNVTFAEKATYYAKDERIVLEGRPRLMYFPDDSEDSNFFD